MPAVKTGFGAPPMPGMPAPMGGMAPMPGMAPMGQPMGGMPMPPMAPPPAPMGVGMPPMGGQMPTMGQGGQSQQGFSMGAPRRRRFGDYLETTLGRFSQPVAADSMGQMNVFTGQMPMQAPMQRPVVGMKRGGLAGGDVEAPRRAVIKGQDHMLAYITPEEAGILKARGGWGGPGPRGIPSYPEPGYGTGGMGDPAGLGPGPSGTGGGGADSGQAAAAADAAAGFGGGPGDFGGGRDNIGYDAFGNVYGSPAQAAVADAVAEAAAAAANVGMGQAGTGGYGVSAAADIASALSSPSAQQSVSQPGLSIMDQMQAIAAPPSAPFDISMTDPMTMSQFAPTRGQSVTNASNMSSMDVAPSYSISDQIAQSVAQDMMSQAAAQNVSDIGRQVDVDAAMNRGGLRGGNFGPGIPGGTVSSANLGLGNMATTGVPGGTGSVSTNVAGSISPAQASGIVSAIGDISRGTGSNVAANEAAAAQMAMNQGITAEDVAMSQPVSVAPGNLSPSNAVAGLDVDMSQDVMGLLGDITPTSASASAPTVSTTGAPATTADIAGMINAVESEVASKGGLTAGRAAEIAANFGVPASEVAATAAATSRGLAAAPSTTSPAAPATAPATSTAAPASNLAAARDAVSSTLSNMGPLSRGQINDIADSFGFPVSDVQAMVDMETAAEAYGTPAVATSGSSSQGLAAAPAAAPAAPAAPSQAAPALTDETDPRSAINQDRAQYRSASGQQSSTRNDLFDQISTAMQNLDPEPTTFENIFGGILNGLTYGLINTDTIVSNRVDAAKSALEGYKSGTDMGDYGVSSFGDQAGEGPDRSCPPGFVYNPSTRTCVPIGSMSSAPTVSDVDVTASDTVGAINVPVRPVETFEEVMARISSGSPTIAPLGQPLRMQAGGAVGLNRAADSFLKALAG